MQLNTLMLYLEYRTINNPGKWVYITHAEKTLCWPIQCRYYVYITRDRVILCVTAIKLIDRYLSANIQQSNLESTVISIGL